MSSTSNRVTPQDLPDQPGRPGAVLRILCFSTKSVIGAPVHSFGFVGEIFRHSTTKIRDIVRAECKKIVLRARCPTANDRPESRTITKPRASICDLLTNSSESCSPTRPLEERTRAASPSCLFGEMRSPQPQIGQVAKCAKW